MKKYIYLFIFQTLSKNNLPSRYCSYELFGIDVLLDSALRPWLLEVNISPSLHSSSPLDLAVKGPLVRELFNLAGFQVEFYYLLVYSILLGCKRCCSTIWQWHYNIGSRINKSNRFKYDPKQWTFPNTLAWRVTSLYSTTWWFVMKMHISRFQVPAKLSKEQETELLNLSGLNGRTETFCYDKRLYTTVLSREEKMKHASFATQPRRQVTIIYISLVYTFQEHAKISPQTPN